ncbi:hypothetical protein D516_0582 [Rhodobacter sp. AKP1]|nr:hypothetical protein D516_0582 [Rhodobacter sp. AKP1]
MGGGPRGRNRVISAAFRRIRPRNPLPRAMLVQYAGMHPSPGAKDNS